MIFWIFQYLLSTISELFFYLFLVGVFLLFSSCTIWPELYHKKERQNEASIHDHLALKQKVAQLMVQIETLNKEILTMQCSMAEVLCRLSKLEAARTSPSPAGSIYNVPIGRSPRGSPIRKWVSSHDIKEVNVGHNLPWSKPTSIGGKHLNTSMNKASSSLSLNTTNNTSSRDLSTISHRGRIARGPSFSSLISSTSSLSRSVPTPIFDASSHSLHVMINNRMIEVPVPKEVKEWDFQQPQPPPSGSPPKLHWIYGLTVKESGNGSFGQLLGGEIVYFVGTIVALYNREEHQQRHYTQHTADVQVVVVHPNRRYVASGQTSKHVTNRSAPGKISSKVDVKHADRDSQAHIRIWDSASLITLHLIGISEHSFEKSIKALSFSIIDNGVYLACIEESYHHMLTVWEWEKGKKIVESRSTHDTTIGIHFHPFLKNTIVQYGKGHLFVWTIDLKSPRIEKINCIFEAKDRPKSVLCICFPDESTMIVGDSNGSISKCDSKTGKLLRVLPGIHPGGVHLLEMTSSKQLLSCGEQREVYIFDANTFTQIGDPIELPAETRGHPQSITVSRDGAWVILMSSGQILFRDQEGVLQILIEGYNDDVTSISLHPHIPRFLITSKTGIVTVWDSEERRLIWRKEFQDNISCSSYSHCGGYIALGTGTGGVKILDGTTRALMFERKYSNHPIINVKFSPSVNVLVISTKEPSLLLLRATPSKPYQTLSRITTLPSPATFIDFSIDGSAIRLTTTMGHLLFFSLQGDTLASTSVRHLLWSSGTCPASYEAAVAVSSSGRVTSSAVGGQQDESLLGLGRDDGVVRLYSSPVLSSHAEYHELKAGSSPVSQICFQKESLFTTCQGNASVLHWKR